MKEEKLVRLIDRALTIVAQRSTASDPAEPLSVEQLRVIMEDLKDLKELVGQGRLEPSRGGQVRITPLRPAIDWGEPDDSTLRSALYEIEIFYSQEF